MSNLAEMIAAIDRENENTASHGGEDEAIAAAVAAACTTEPAGAGHVITMLTEETSAERWAFRLDRPGRPPVIAFAPRGAVSFTYEGVEYPLPVLPDDADHPEPLREAYEALSRWLIDQTPPAEQVLPGFLELLDPCTVLESLHTTLGKLLDEPTFHVDDEGEWDEAGDLRFTTPEAQNGNAKLLSAASALLAHLDRIGMTRDDQPLMDDLREAINSVST